MVTLGIFRCMEGGTELALALVVKVSPAQSVIWKSNEDRTKKCDEAENTFWWTGRGGGGDSGGDGGWVTILSGYDGVDICAEGGGDDGVGMGMTNSSLRKTSFSRFHF